MKRDPNWNQESPIVQLRVLLGSIEGDMTNMVNGIVRSPKVQVIAARVLRHVKESQQLATAIAKGDCKWDDTETH